MAGPVVDVEEAPVLQAVDGVLAPRLLVDRVPLLLDTQRGDTLQTISTTCRECTVIQTKLG